MQSSIKVCCQSFDRSALPMPSLYAKQAIVNMLSGRAQFRTKAKYFVIWTILPVSLVGKCSVGCCLVSVERSQMPIPSLEVMELHWHKLKQIKDTKNGEAKLRQMTISDLQVTNTLSIGILCSFASCFEMVKFSILQLSYVNPERFMSPERGVRSQLHSVISITKLNNCKKFRTNVQKNV